MAETDVAARAVVLVVEDDPATRGIETRVLEDDGFTVLQANTGEAGLRLAQEHRPGLILLDLALPRMSGFDLLHALKSTSSTVHIPVLLVSAYASLVDDCGQRGASGWIAKPFSVDELLAGVHRLLHATNSHARRAQPELRARPVEK